MEIYLIQVVMIFDCFVPAMAVWACSGGGASEEAGGASEGGEGQYNVKKRSEARIHLALQCKVQIQCSAYEITQPRAIQWPN